MLLRTWRGWATSHQSFLLGAQSERRGASAGKLHANVSDWVCSPRKPSLSQSPRLDREIETGRSLLWNLWNPQRRLIRELPMERSEGTELQTTPVEKSGHGGGQESKAVAQPLTPACRANRIASPNSSGHFLLQRGRFPFGRYLILMSRKFVRNENERDRKKIES